VGDLHEELRDERPRQRGREGIGALVERPGPDGRPDEALDELPPGVDDVGPAGSGAQGPIGDAGAERTAADVDGQGDDLGVVLLAQPGDRDRRVQPALVGKHDLLHRAPRAGLCEQVGNWR